MLLEYGMALLTSLSSVLQEHTVIESKPDSAVEDLRFHSPWPALKDYAAEFDIDTKDPLTHKHIPYGIILLKVTEEWKASHDGKLPSTSKERNEFKVGHHSLEREACQSFRTIPL
jgi:amyloid beta precursor protein binding protein 1